ncbi:hypothetical protein ACPA9J_12695 [Pseudomonas aeruginosa]
MAAKVLLVEDDRALREALSDTPAAGRSRVRRRGLGGGGAAGPGPPKPSAW